MWSAGRLSGHAPKSGIRSTMISSIRGNVVGDCDVVDDNVASKARDVGDNGGMTCEVEASGGGVEYEGGMKVSGMVWNTRVVWKSHQWNDQ